MRFLAVVGGAVAASLSAGVSAEAQLPELPTLADAGLEYISPGGLLQITLSGQLDLEAIHVGDAWVGLVTREGGEVPLPESHQSCTTCHVGMQFPAPGGALAAHRLRVFADVFLGDHVYSRVEARADRGHVPTDGAGEGRLEQAFVRFSGGRGLGLQIGRFASPFGSYALRHLSEVDPFLRPPLAYDYRTVMSRTLIPRDADFFLRWKGDPEFFRKPGAPPVWDVPYQWGAMGFGRLGPLQLRVAAMNSAPSSGPGSWGWDRDRFEHPSWIVGLRMRPFPELDVGASYNRGPWMETPVAGTVQPLPGAPAGAAAPGWRDFEQELVSLDATFARGPMMLRAEVMRDGWEVPNVADTAREWIYSAELQWDLAAGFSVAGRYGAIDFREVSDGLGTASPRPYGATDWDHDVQRYEGSVGYRLSRNMGLLVSAFRQAQAGGTDGDSTFGGMRLWWAF